MTRIEEMWEGSSLSPDMRERFEANKKALREMNRDVPLGDSRDAATPHRDDDDNE